MKFQFSLPNGYSTAHLTALNRVYVKLGPVRRWLVPICRGILIFFGALLLLGGLIMLLGGAAEEGLGSAIAVFLVVGLLWLLLGLFRYRINAWSSRRLTLGGLGSITAVLDQSGVTETSGKGTCNYPYSAFVAAAFYRGTYFLFLDKRHAVILPLTAMTQGAPALFEEFWSQQCGKEIQHFSH